MVVPQAPGALSRRHLLGMAGVGGASIVLAGCADDTKNPNVKTAPDESDTADVELLNAMLDMEFTTIAAYKAGAAELSGRVLQIAQDVLEQEQEHADTLSRAIRDLDGVPNRAKDSYDFRALRNERDVLRFAVELENNAIAAYVDVLPKLSQGELRSTVSGILTCEAEHACVALGALGEPQLPGAFVVGQAS